MPVSVLISLVKARTPRIAFRILAVPAPHDALVPDFSQVGNLFIGEINHVLSHRCPLSANLRPHTGQYLGSHSNSSRKFTISPFHVSRWTTRNPFPQ